MSVSWTILLKRESDLYEVENGQNTRNYGKVLKVEQKWIKES